MSLNQSNRYNIVDGFDRIAKKYDQVNDVISLGLHRVWRKKLCKKIIKNTPVNGTVLDVSTGSGDVLLGILNNQKDFKLIGLDPSQEMLKHAEEKISCIDNQVSSDLRTVKIKLIKGLGEELNGVENESIDTISIAWGIRNIPDYSLALKRFYQVLKPGGCVLILESATPKNFLFKKIHQLYSKSIPLIGGKISGYQKAYEYYNDTVSQFPFGNEFLTHLNSAGFAENQFEALTNGLVYVYQGLKAK